MHVRMRITYLVLREQGIALLVKSNSSITLQISPILTMTSPDLTGGRESPVEKVNQWYNKK